jgi:hypothetical protein
MPRNPQTPSPRTISGVLYVVVLVIAVALAHVAGRAPLG